LLAGIDLLTGQVHALVKDRHRSREFIEFLKILDAAYPAHTAIKLILDNHSAHISKETKAWLADQPPTARIHLHAKARLLAQSRRGFFSKLTRSVLRTSASHPSRNSRIASWPPWTSSTDILSSTLGPINSTRPPDMIRTLETMY